MKVSNNFSQKEKILSVKDLTVKFNKKIILDNVNLDMFRGEILGIIGPSGVGKSVLMRSILGLVPHTSGQIKILGKEFNPSKGKSDIALSTKLGVLFQRGALFPSLTVYENICTPIREHLDISEPFISDIVRTKISMVGLPVDIATAIPAQLSGGMTKRVALARSLAIDPDLIFLDEPTSGLDPIGAAEFDTLLIKLHNTLGLTVYMITHDLDSLLTICSRVIVMGEKGIVKEGTVQDMLDSYDPWIKSYFKRMTRRGM
ncbi:ABC transporter ATP-binding protein [Candidatus Liberibacter sp.]|uniref:ABC transporter ATP-binding protein n=1 Tax=Candidatus Liberibacter sp. TaxID=34022 RepID=UPI0015F36BD5|nr:ATP-binding cassette domain-containing protein [Candidatus Liberibacter sp.]MBA5724480.1 ATP-binding cassette domain-containing protein [Candidatus Liberibacter sp.]